MTMVPYVHPDSEDDQEREDNRLRALEARLEMVEEEVRTLRRRLDHQRHVDLIDTSELRAFLYTDDLAYIQLEACYKRSAPSSATRLDSLPRRSPEERYANPSEPLMPLLFSHYWVQGLEFSYFDIGCQYGIAAMTAAQIVRASGRATRIYAFDPGVAADLVPFSLLINGLQDMVRFERMAISSATFPTIVFTSSGHSEDNRIVNRNETGEHSSYVVPATSIDDYVEREQIAGPVILKIDTQGAEVEVFAGMKRVLGEHLVACVSEFTPHAIAPRQDPAGWLSERMAQFRVFDMGELDLFLQPHRQMPEIRDPAALVDAMDQGGRANTDLLLLPRALPGMAMLLERIALQVVA